MWMIIISLLLLVTLILLMYKSYSLENYDSIGLVDYILYINLDHRKDRDNSTKKELKKYFPDITPNRISAVLTPENGAIGCLKSHISMCKYALENFRGGNILFCEDDIEFIENPVKYLQIFFNDKKFRDWDVLMIGHNTYNSMDTHNENVIRILGSQTTSCYLIKYQYISKLLSVYENCLKDFNNTKIWKTEHCSDQCWKVLQPIDKWYTFKTRICKQRESYSDIQKGVVNYNL